MYQVFIIIVTCISPPQFIKLKTVKRKGGHELTVSASQYQVIQISESCATTYMC
ncbi:hypothetical protein Hanom_Chr04g00357141 [Helianthus anomalus]